MNRLMEARWWVAVLVLGHAVSGDAVLFGAGEHAFDLTFREISGETYPAGGTGRVAYDYGIGTYEITADQWDKYLVNTDHVNSGSIPSTTGSEAVNFTSWDEAAQFVNWLNTSSGYAPAYNFDAEGTFSLWSADEQSATSAYRHKDAIYVLPSEDEWTKAAYWSGTTRQIYATLDGDVPSMVEANYGNEDGSIWQVGSGAEELNGTYDMMGNVCEWTESAANGVDAIGEFRAIRGGSYADNSFSISIHDDSMSGATYFESGTIGFRVAVVPEPASIALIGLFGGGVLLIRRIFMM
ncbi:MAG: SUMF1/EgtB/PvdO family nonheme iron enzyme [Pontiella sp.]